MHVDYHIPLENILASPTILVYQRLRVFLVGNLLVSMALRRILLLPLVWMFFLWVIAGLFTWCNSYTYKHVFRVQDSLLRI